jgi:ABC-2 type transport system permease protein
VLLMLVLYVLAQVATVFGLTTVLTLRMDETAGLAEPILTTATSRVRWLGASLIVAASGVALVLVVLGAASGLGASTFGRLLGTSVAFLPACLVLVGLATALYGWAPRLAVPVTWAAFGVVLVVDLLGEFGLLGMPWLLISPYIAILSAVRGASELAPSMLLLCGVAAVLFFAGMAGIRRRDLGA